jgi:hypothetical protein
VACAHQLDRADDGGPAAQHFAGQAHGLVKIVSRNAVFDRHLVQGRDHRTMIMPPLGVAGRPDLFRPSPGVQLSTKSSRGETFGKSNPSEDEQARRHSRPAGE